MAVYNAEAYIERSVKSVLAQTFKDIELILVDDGSTDNSDRLCDSYSTLDGRVHVIHKENGGVSSARQCGIDFATGDYTLHVDPDDWIEPDMIEVMYEKAIKENADIVICDMLKETGQSQKRVAQAIHPLNHQSVLIGLFTSLHGSCCNKLIKLDCYHKYKVSFPLDLSYCEDLYVCSSILKNEVNVAYVERALYHYDTTVNENSLVKKAKFDIKKDLYLREKFVSLLRFTPAYKSCKRSMNYTILHHLFLSNNYKGLYFIVHGIPYFTGVLSHGKSKKMRLLLFLSLIGLYNPCYNYFVNR